MRFAFLLFLMLPLGLNAQILSGDYDLEVRITGYDSVRTVWLHTYNKPNSGDDGEIDTAMLTSSSFQFHGKIVEPDVAMLYFIYRKKGWKTITWDTTILDFFLVPGQTIIKVAGPFRHISFEGKKSVTDYAALLEKQRIENGEFITISEKFENSGRNEWDYKDELHRLLDSFHKVVSESIYLPYIRNNAGSELLLYALQEMVPLEIDSADKYLSILNKLPQPFQQLPSARQLKKRLYASRALAIGQFFPALIQYDTMGKKTTVKKFKGKIVLVDFWASWCTPCRLHHPDLVKIFNQYKDSNFTIWGIALEKKNETDKWKNAIKKDSLNWPQATDFKYWDNALIEKLGIHSVPFNILLDQDGRIVAKNLEGLELERKISQLVAMSH